MSLATKIERWLCRILRIPTCQELEVNYYDYLAAAVNRKEKRAIERHLALCRRCKKFFASYKKVVTLSPKWTLIPPPFENQEQIIEKVSRQLSE